MKPRTFAGVALTAIWCVGVAALMYWKRGSFGELKLNEWGDFFAGTVAPLALFWLVLGYAQQGEELQTNTDALKAQEEQLRLQVKETADLVAMTARQAAAAEIHAATLRDQSDRARQQAEASAQPRFSPSGGNGAPPMMLVFLTNTGALARKLAVERHPDGTRMRFLESEVGSGGQVSLEIEGQPEYPFPFAVRFIDSNGVSRSKSYVIERAFKFRESFSDEISPAPSPSAT